VTDYGFYFTGSLEVMINLQLVNNNDTLCFLQESLLFCVFNYFTNPFQAVSNVSHYREGSGQPLWKAALWLFAAASAEREECWMARLERRHYTFEMR
jgi:hypothetical protein